MKKRRVIGYVLAAAALLLAAGGIWGWYEYTGYSKYHAAAVTLEKELEDVYDNGYIGLFNKMVVPAFDADMFMIVDRKADKNLVYLEPDVQSEIRRRQQDQKGRLLLVWLKGNYKILHIHDCETYAEHWRLLWRENLFPAAKDSFVFFVFKSELIENQIRIIELRFQK